MRIRSLSEKQPTYKVRTSHYHPDHSDPGDPEFGRALKTKVKTFKSFKEAAEASLFPKKAKIKDTDKYTVVETLLTVDENGRERPMNREERIEIRFIKSQTKTKV